MTASHRHDSDSTIGEGGPFLRWRDGVKMIGISNRTAERLAVSGADFPKVTRLGPKLRYFSRAEVTAWIHRKLAETGAPPSTTAHTASRTAAIEADPLAIPPDSFSAVLPTPSEAGEVCAAAGVAPTPTLDPPELAAGAEQVAEPDHGEALQAEAEHTEWPDAAEPDAAMVAALVAEMELGDDLAKILARAGFPTVRAIARADLDTLAGIDGFDLAFAAQVQQRAQDAYARDMIK